MKRMLVSGATAVALLFGAAALAQTSTTTTTTGATGSTTTITTDQQAKIKAYVTKEKVKSVAAPSGVTISAGSTLPQTIELHTLPSDVGVTQYRYAVVGDRTVLVDPGTRRIVQVIQ